MAEAACKLCKPRQHSFAKDGRKTSWNVVQKSGLRQKLEDDIFRVEEYHGSMPRYKYRIMIHRNDFYLRVAVSSDLDKLLQKYWQYFHSVLPTMIPASVQDEKSRMTWVIQHITFMYKQEKKHRSTKLQGISDEDLDLHHLEDLEDLSQWSSEEEEDSYSISADEAHHLQRLRSDSDASITQNSPPKHSSPPKHISPLTAADKLKFKVSADTKSFSDPNVVQKLSTSPPKVTFQNSTEHDSHTDLNNNNNNNNNGLDSGNLTRSNSCPQISSEENSPIVACEEKKRSKWKQFFKRKPEDTDSDEAHEEKEPKKLERDDMSRLSIYASIDRPQKSPSLFRKLKKKSEQDITEGIHSQEKDKSKDNHGPEMDTKAFIKAVVEELFDPDAPRDVRTYKYCILGVLFACFYAACLRFSSFDLFVVLLIVLNVGIVYMIKERRTLISMFAKRKLRKVVKQEKKKFLGWLPNNSKETIKVEKDKEKERTKEEKERIREEKDREILAKQAEAEPTGTS